ncbi:ATP-dependent DNA helicase RecG [Endomicrobium proavitum]|uniref:ATP-dependent DNA helicase RecG n=1 Tax=Endomicrobium proavitum TaxID=1408281 RepID=A0A0G3WIY7_9BACT|nr:ATP-dependent DNA helicase RecG [Endomicrobium proavitum]AKL97842.1 ATP-dependent DNA helicase [Endomicrobium proavitum]
MKAMNLNSDVKYIKGIGPKRALAFLKLGVKSAGDLLTLFPAQYQDRTQTAPISEAYFTPHACISGKIGKSYERKLSMGLSILDVEIFDSSGMTYVRFFRKKSSYSKVDVFASIKNSFAQNKFAYIFGDAKAEIGARYINVQDYEITDSPDAKPEFFNKIIPVYPATEGLSQKVIRAAVKSAVTSLADIYYDISDIIPQFEQCKISAREALKKIHYPQSMQDAENARRAFALQEFFVLESALALSRAHIKKDPKKQKYEIKKTLLTPFKNNLTFEFTKAQKKAINEIFTDMQNELPANRMIMGDVGSGKTVVALSAILLAAENGYQSMIAAPTEILAQQHYLTISNMFEGLGVQTVLATSSTLKKKSDRDKILSSIISGETTVVVGTHSLIEDRIEFKNLALVVVDEQHRFGVMQKSRALAKAKTPDTLMMTATPIPRALAMTLYGEMDMTTINELPPGRIPIKTYIVSESAAYANAVKELKSGGQAYIVFPLIDESDKIELKAATVEAEKLSESYFKNFKVGLLHGKMKPAEKNAVMKSFKNKEFDVLIATTVIEVGIDVPNATVMIIQHADRFGLSALHQLRGRIGRGKKQSYCYLVGSVKSENARKRLSIMAQTNNGFKIAQEDLQMRGPGEFMGTTQHGFPEFKAGDLIKDADIIEFTKDCARKLIEDDPKLEKSENLTLKKLIAQKFADKLKFINVG